MNGKTATTIGDLPAAGRQRGGDRRRGAQAHGGAEGSSSRPASTTAIALDTSLFTLNSIDKVVHTFFEAVVLVVLVVFVFLQSLRATIIPILAVPVSIIGTFIGMHLLGFSINMLTLFGMILAIGLVVDDAIVVVENVEANMASKGLSPLEAAKEAMTQIAGALISIVLVLRRRVPAGRVPGRRHRQALQAVRHHHRDLDGDLRRSWRSRCRPRWRRSSSRRITARRTASSAGSSAASSGCARATSAWSRARSGPGRLR